MLNVFNKNNFNLYFSFLCTHKLEIEKKCEANELKINPYIINHKANKEKIEMSVN